MWEQVLLGGLIINTLCYMISHCKTRLAKNSMARLLNHGFFHVGLFPKACTLFERPCTLTLNIYVYVGTSFIGWFDDKLILPLDLSLSDMPSKIYGQAPQPWVFQCWLLNQGLPFFGNAPNMDPKHICLCGNKIYCVV